MKTISSTNPANPKIGRIWVQTISTATLALVLTLTISCDTAGTSALVGHWLHENGPTKGKPEDIELFKDGTGVCDGGSISWKVEGKRFIIQSSTLGFASDYEVSGYRLTLTSNGEKITYVNINKNKGSLTDSRDKKKYGTVKIGDQTWMSENLNYNADGSKCYENDESNCQKYGRLYNWETAKSACPKGWHLPSKEEWQTLVDFAGGDEVTGKKFKARSGWDDYERRSGNGTDIYSFSALPGGSGSSGGSFSNVGNRGLWWSSSETNSYNAYFRIMNYNYENVDYYNNDKSRLFSVRCLQDYEATAAEKAAAEKAAAEAMAAAKTSVKSFTDSRDGKAYKTVAIGKQTWMAQNLNYDMEGGKCYDNNQEHCEKYGRFYNWNAATKACPSGWHLPSNAEWDALYRLVDGTSGTKSPYESKTAGKYLKAASGWNDCKEASGNGEDAFNFSALPGGSGNYSGGGFNHIGNNGYWWSSSENNAGGAYYRFMLCESARAGWNSNTKALLLNVRCVKD